MNFIFTLTIVLAGILGLGCVILFAWAMIKFGKSYKYERYDPYATLPKGVGFLKLISPKYKKKGTEKESHILYLVF